MHVYMYTYVYVSFLGVFSKEQLHGFLEESLIMKDFHHPHILGLLGVCFDAPDGSPYIVLPFMANGSVKTYLKERRVHPTNFDESPVVIPAYPVFFNLNAQLGRGCNIGNIIAY